VKKVFSFYRSETTKSGMRAINSVVLCLALLLYSLFWVPFAGINAKKSVPLVAVELATDKTFRARKFLKDLPGELV
jgi:hypothetical protein